MRVIREFAVCSIPSAGPPSSLSRRAHARGAFILAFALLTGVQPAFADTGKSLWARVSHASAAADRGKGPGHIRPTRSQTHSLNRRGMAALLAGAPRERSRAARDAPLVIQLPDPNGGFQRFALVDSPVMEDGLAAKHPEIKTYAGRGLDDPTATIRADLTPLGFHASVRSAQGAWYIDPIDHRDPSLYVTYYGRDLKESPHGVFTDVVETENTAAEISTNRAFYHPPDAVTLRGAGFTANAQITITISDPLGVFAARTVTARADTLGTMDVEFEADPSGSVGVHDVQATDGTSAGTASYDVVADEDASHDPPTGDVLRIYRLALITDPGYASFFGGSANVTAAKVTLINRVTQLYEADLSIRLVLVNNNDLLNFDTWEQATGPNGPCGSAACFTQSQVTGCSSTSRARFVIGQIIGASNYDIGHLALGQPGGGVANLGVIGRSNKAGGCTGIPTPVGDYYAVDYVAHEMGHQFSGNHPFNGNQLNCSGGNRSAATSVEPGSGSSIMAYAGICLTDDLQPHSDPYFSQRSLQEITTYTTSNQAAINEVQTVSLRHFGGGNEVQTVTFSPGFAPASTIQPLSLAISAAPSATSRGGAEEDGNTVTIATGNAHTLQVGDIVTIAGVAVAGYNGTWTVTARPSSRSFQYANPVSGLAPSGGGTVTLAAPGATESGTTVTISTAAAHGRTVGDVITISGVGVAGYNGTFSITAVPTPRTFQYTAAAGLASSGGGTATFFSPFSIRIAGNESVLIGGSGLAYTNGNLQAAINAVPGFAGTVTVTGAASTGFTITYGGASAGVDVPNVELAGLGCGACVGSVEETNHGGANDWFTVNYNGSVSMPITNGANYTAAGILAALTPILPAGSTATVAGFAGGPFNNTGFQVTFTGALAATNVPVMLAVQGVSNGASGFVGETDKGGAVDNKGGIITATGNSYPVVTSPPTYTIPLRTPFYLTGSATDPDNDTLTYIWEQNDRGGTAGTSLLNNTKPNGALFAMFPISGPISDSDALTYNSPGENHVTTSPTRIFPDLQQILDNNTNADTGVCPGGSEIAPPVPTALKECFAEFLPTTDYVGFTNVNASPLSLHFRLTARDGKGGVNAADTTLLLATNAGPFKVTSPHNAVTWEGGSVETVTWNVANTDVAPTSTSQVVIRLSTDGGYTYPLVLAASTANDGSEAIVVPNVATARARVLIEAVGNIFFDLTNADFAILARPVVTNALGEGGSLTVQYSDALWPAVSVSASDADSDGADLTAAAAGLPAGLSLTVATTSGGGLLPGTRTWGVTGFVTAAPGAYPVVVSVTDQSGLSAQTSFTIVVAREDADVTYAGDMLAFTGSGGTATVLLRATVRDSSVIAGSGDLAAGDVRNATATFKEGSITLCSAVPVQLIDGALTTGTATCSVVMPEGMHLVEVVANNYYVGTGSGIVEVASPSGNFVTAGGYHAIQSSSGRYAADAGSKMNVGFNVQYTAGVKNPKGHVTVLEKRNGKTYQIKSTAIDSLGIAFRAQGSGSCTKPSPTCVGFADLRAKATLTDVTDPLRPIALGGGFSLQVTITDKGEPGTADSVGVTLWDGNALLFSSEWRGAKTVEGLFDGGNAVVH